MRALTRVATPENEADLLELAGGCTTEQIERTVRSWKRGTRMEEVELDRERHESRCLSVFPDVDGMYVVKGRLAAEVGALLMRALAAGLAGADSDASAVSGTRAERYQVLLHVEPETLTAGGGSGRSEFEDGTRVSPETSRRISCDAGVVRITHQKGGSVMNAGRRTRTIPPALRRALDARDRGCRFPGCGLRFTDAHHVRHWADGGETSLGNCLLLCRHHHGLVHEGGWSVVWWGDANPAFFDRRGGTHFDGRWKPPELPERPVEALLEQNRRSGVAPDGWTAGARWKREVDIPNEIYLRALNAIA